MKKENIKINCPVCNVLLNIKNLGTHLRKHGICIPNLNKYTRQNELSADRKLEIYREIEDIKELTDNNMDQDELMELQNRFKELKIMLTPIPLAQLNKILKDEIAKAHITITHNVLKKDTNKISSYRNEMAKFSRIVGGVLRTENIEKQTLPMVGTNEFYETFMELIPNMVESFLIKKEKEKFGVEKSIEFYGNSEKGYPSIENITIEEMTKRTNYRRDMKKISNITKG
ncbi:hypothetical protein, partial [Sulfurovum riftiae]|uniref:hypothetical protein n=1 Tax=Sulfurovum riftiae TaxID=1630136 RepID=UPI000B2C5391